MIIVAGRIHVSPGQREAFLTLSQPAIIPARRAPGCYDFVVSPDPVESERVNVFERWESPEALLALREAGPSADLGKLIERVEVRRYVIASEEAP